MIEAAVVLAYLAVVLYVGIFAFRRGKPTGEDYFLASRSLGTLVFLLSLFGTNMTAFTILGSSGKAFREGIGVYGLMASSSALIIPLLIFLIGPRLWAMGKRHGHVTPVDILRGRWEAGHIGTVIFALQAVLLVPYIIIGVMGGGQTLNALSGGAVPEWLGGAVVALVVMSYVFFGGMRGTAWVNAIQTTLFLTFGLAAFIVIGRGMGGYGRVVGEMLSDATLAPLLTCEKMNPYVFFSYTFIPLSSIAFPHIGIFCLTARRMSSFRRTAVLYPICILAIWLPCVFLGTVAAADPQIQAAVAAGTSGDQVMLLLLRKHAPGLFAGILGAGIMAAVMASDSQILALSTMFSEDLFAYYGGRKRFGPRAEVAAARAFVVLATAVAYAAAMTTTQGIFDLAIKYAFTGYSALAPILVAAVFWKRSTKYGALASALVTAAGLIAIAWLEAVYPLPQDILKPGGVPILSRTPGGIAVYRGLLPVVPLVVLSSLAMVVASLLTKPPSRETIERYFG